MARKLPWASPRNANTTSSTTSAPATPIPNLLARQISPHGHASHTPQTCPPATGPSRARSSSITPPPEQFMIPLLDDKYRMVEDELLHTAQQYTTHLHRAEYIRLKAVISSRNAYTIREMERPVVPSSGGSTPHGRAVRVRRKIVEGKKAVLMGEEAPWMGTSLQGLMEKGDGKGGGRERSRTMPSYEGVSGGGSEEGRLRRDGEWRVERRKRVKEEEEGGEEEEEQKEEDSDDDDDDGDDPFGVQRRWARRVQSRERERERDRDREMEKEKEKDRSREGEKRQDVMPSFL
ncbi:hypothetical protein E4U59_005689 [Claviceps monticola]|nr:hypothetical protein E4U59_005689 [Claviceps monticola]